ncbi:hypothetical protein DV738_g319, partial [Chaetothyriales sp. CBS 135597]
MASSSRPSPTFMIEQYGTRSPSLPPPPPLPLPPERRGGSPEQERGQGSRRAARLPSLTTNLPLPPPPPGSAAHPQLLTPLSSVSLSSPFTTARPHPYSPSTAALSRDPSPMALRMPSYNVPYNPSQWASGSATATATATNERLDPEGGLAPPPPPYSPPHTQTRASTAATAGVMTAMAPTHATVLVSPPAETLTPPGLRPGLHTRDPGVPLNRTIPPPPPRPSAADAARRSGILPKARPVSVASLGEASRVHRNYFATRVVSTHQSRHLSIKIGVGKHKVATRGTSKRAFTRSANTGLNPANTSSRSYAEHTYAPHLHIRTSNLGPSIPSQDFFPATEPVGEPGGSSRAFGAALNRSTAFRDSSAQGLRERRNLRKSLLGPDTAPDLSALSVNTNPWAEAMASAASTNQSPIALSDHSQSPDQQEYNSAPSSIVERPSGSGFDPKTSALSPDPLAPLSVASNPTPRSPRLAKLKGPVTPRAPLQVQPPKTLPTPPLSQKAPESARSLGPLTSLAPNETSDRFSAESLQRHHDFLQNERHASTSEQKLQTFVDYIVVESVLRRRRYATTLEDGRIDFDAARKRLFDDADKAVKAFLEHTAGVDTPAGSVSSTFEDGRVRPESAWWSQYQPALSPIASMSNDEMSSRGRSSSRWWESQAGSQTDGNVTKVRRSKRESKYMGLSATLMQMNLNESDTPKNLYFNGAWDSEYPDEKANPESFGYSDDTTQGLGKQRSADVLDLSRFITLPPPYPRHYPAVNNAHPLLSDYRHCVRAMSDLSEIQARKSRHALSVQALRNQHNQRLVDGRAAFKDNIQVQIQEGTISYAEAAEAEEALRMEEQKAEQATLKAEFDTLQDVVTGPLHQMLSDRVVQLSARIDELTAKLFVDAQQQNPDQPQQEGDDTPELLEYLTQLKWMFETREQIHKEIFDLLTERNEKYKAIVLLPYQQANNVDKVRDTEAFFVRDNLDQAKTYCQESVNRHEQFFNIIEDNVARGVGLQSSAFWDLVPALLELLQEVPTDIAHIRNIAIPDQEYLENPSYFRYPQQYLYTLLDHAEKSTYQFIEAQINLHCLLHEVKTSVLLARCRLMDANEHIRAQPPPSTTKISDYRAKEEASLTIELKQKVSIIEEQWLDAIGSQLQHAREEVKTYLEAEGAWEEVTSDD